MRACSISVNIDPNSTVWWLQTHVEWDRGGKGCVTIHLTGKQCTITTSALLFFTYLLIEATCGDGISVYFLGPYVEIQAGENHSNASREMIDMGAFLVMYKNVPLIAVHSCSGACWKIPSPPRAPGPPSPGSVSPTNPNAQSGVQVPTPSPVYLLPPPPTPALALAHTLWYALKFNQMLNYILTWVPTSWLYSPVSD